MRKLIFTGLLAAAAFFAIPSNAQADIYGPQASITCPVGATAIATNQNISTIVAAAANGTKFCLAAGTHTPTAPINLKSAQELWGTYGAIIDGTNVVQGFDTGSTAIIRVWNAGTINGGTIKNLVIKNLASYNCIGLYGYSTNDASNWTIDHNEISGCNYGVNVGYLTGLTVSYNYIHHNSGNPDYSGGYGANVITSSIFDHNHFAYNGPTGKVTQTDGVTFSNNLIDHQPVGIWYDGDNINSTISANTISDTQAQGIFYEISASGSIHNNTITRAGDQAIFISTSRDTEVYSNTIIDSYRAVALFVNCVNVHDPGIPYTEAIGWDLRNNSVHDNTVQVSTQIYALANYMSQANCSASQLAPYLDGTKSLTFATNTYTAPTTSGNYFQWGDTVKNFTQWQAIPQDAAGSMSLIVDGTPVTDTLAPSVSIGKPSSGAVITGVTVLEAGATDNIGVVGVQFYVNGVAVGNEDTTSPYQAQWDTSALADTTYSITAVARDAAGNQGTSATVTVTTSNAAPSSDTIAPTVSLLAPATVARRSLVTLQAVAADNVGVTQVQFFYQDGTGTGVSTRICADTTSPYTCAWRVPSQKNKNGWKVYAQAFDAAGNIGTSTSTIVKVQ